MNEPDTTGGAGGSHEAADPLPPGSATAGDGVRGWTVPFGRRVHLGSSRWHLRGFWRVDTLPCELQPFKIT